MEFDEGIHPESKNRLSEDLRTWQATKGYKKLWNYYLNLLESSAFQKDVREARVSIGIPGEGFPKDWNPDYNSAEIQVMLREVHDASWKLAEKYGFDSTAWEETFSFYLTQNYISEPDYGGLLTLTSLEEEREEPFSAFIMNVLDKAFPIFLRISPYASKRDILDFVSKKYKTLILPNQKRYRDEKTNIGKVRSRQNGVKERNTFIYENRHLPRKELMRLANDKFGGKLTVDYGYIGKIISLEKKRKES